MYVGVDVGGTKTLVAALDGDGVISEQVKFPSPDDYEKFLIELRRAVNGFKTQDFQAAGVAIPGRLDRRRGWGIKLGNLPWTNFNIQDDAEKILQCPVVIENDAKLAGLSEALLLKDKYHRVVYLTISTGIGYALLVDGVIDSGIGDGGGRSLLLPHRGKPTPWEDFASGKAIVQRYGQRAEDITDEATWQEICRDLALGLIQLIAVMEPEVIVFGGSVGVYFDRYGKTLATELEKYKLPLLSLPALRRAKRPEEAVIYGCYDLAKQVYGHAKADR